MSLLTPICRRQRLNELKRSAQYLLAGIRIDAITRQDLLDTLDEAREQRQKRLILNHNLHSIYLYLTSPEFRAVYALAADVYIDGMWVLWMARLAGLPLEPEQRITFLDCFEDMLSHAEAKSWRIYYLGSSAEVLSEGVDLLRSRYPQLHVAGHHGYVSMGGEDTAEVIREINAFRPDILFVGMGMPLQEFWIARNLPFLEVTGVLTCGATLEYMTGHTYRPPAWAGPLGLYGIMRMLHDPKRLWRRYLYEPMVLSRKLFLPILKQRHRT